MKFIVGIIVSFLTIALNSFATPSWQSPALSNGQLRIDGQLHKRFQLGRLSGSPEFAFPVYLEHSFSKYPYGEFERFSHWTVPQLVTYATPMRRGIFWLSPGGEEHFFTVNDPANPIYATKPAKLSTSYAAIRSRSKEEADRIQIVSKDGFTYVYDKGLLNYLEAPSGRRLYFRTNGIRITGMEQRIDNAAVELLSAEYDQLNRLVALKIGPVTHHFSYVGDSEMLASWKPFDLKERETSFGYDGGILSAITYANGLKENFAWFLTLADFENTERFYPMGRKFAPVLKADSDYIYAYGQAKQGIIMQKSNQLGHTDAVIFDPSTNRLTSIDPAGARTSVVWGKGFGNEATEKLREVISPRGETLVKLDYDQQGRVSQMTKRGEMPVRYKYDELDRIVEVQRGDYPPVKYTYMAATAKPVSITNPFGDSKEFVYGPDGQLLTYKNEVNAIQAYTYDSLGRLTRRNYPLDVWIAWEYDIYGRQVKRTYSNGNSMAFEYDEYGQTKKVVENDEIIWEYAYYPSGRLKQLMRNGVEWLRVEHEIKGDREYLAFIDQKGAENKKVFSLDGKLLEDVNPLGDTIQYKYDPVGQLGGWEAPDGSSVKFDYDSRGKMVFHENHIGQTLERTYDDFGSLAESQTKEQASKIDRDRFGRITRYDYGGGQVTEIAYDDYGRIASLLSGGVTTKVDYDALDRPLRRLTEYPDGSSLAVVIRYAKAGMRESFVNAFQAADGTEAERSVVEYQYDALNRPIEARMNGAIAVKYLYDPKTQMLQKKLFPNGNESIYSYNKNFRLTKIESYDASRKLIGGVEYDWHADGNLVGKRVW